jgi:hypothetical protein
MKKIHKQEELRYCRHPESNSWWEYDARGIPLTKVCDICADAKLSMYRGDVRTDPNYWTDEPVGDI